MSPGDANKKIPKSTFVSRNLVTIVVIPGLIAMHYGWMLLQENKSLVREDEKIELPIISAAKYLWSNIRGTVPVKEPEPTK